MRKAILLLVLFAAMTAMAQNNEGKRPVYYQYDK